ncbi:MAG: GntR family transcriptional regulator [Halomonadaceae bacterium]|nr:MAG: GntR family transcriptional regulator [Halomonadaceae bacterium]
MRFQAPESLSEQIAQHLGQRIIEGGMRPGERIQELKVAGDLDVSRGSVREALLILERRHLIHIYPRKGAVVSGLSPELVQHLYDIYSGLLIMLAQKLAVTWQDKDLEPMARQVQWLLERIDAPDVTTPEIVQGGFEVMRLGYQVVGNPFLQETLENFRPAISRMYFLALQQYGREKAATREFFHQLLIDVYARDHGAIENTIRRFREHQLAIVLDTLKEDASLTSSVTS